MHAKISGNFPDYTISICKSTTDACFLFKLKTSKNCKGVNHNMIMIIAVIYIFLYFLIFHEELKIAFRKSSGPPEKIHSPLFTHFSSPLKIQNMQVPPFLPTMKIFAESSGEDTLWN